MNNQTTSASPAGNGIKAQTLFAGTNLLLVLIYGSIIVLMIVLFVKRVINRVTFASQQRNPAGSGSNKSTKAFINKKLDEAIDFAFEPRLLPEDHDNHENEDMPSYMYRMKAVDALHYIDDALLDANTDLQRPEGKSLREHLLAAKSHSSGFLKSIRTNQLHLFSDMYQQARCSPEPFAEQELKRYMDLNNDIVNTLRHRTNKKKQKEKRLQRQNAVSPEKNNDAVSDTQASETAYATTTLTELPQVSLQGAGGMTSSSMPSPGVMENEKSDSQPLLSETRT